MTLVVRHIPTFVEREAPAERAEVFTLKDLLAIPWVADWTTGRGYTFLHWSVERGVDGVYLMAHYLENGEEKFWVVARLSDDVTTETLPSFRETPEQTARREAWNRGER